VRIFIADDHAVVRRGLRQILADEFPDAGFGEAENSQAALERIAKGTWDVVILDLSMPGLNGIELLKELKALYPKLPVLILSIHPEDQFATRALRAGAAGYMNKETAPAELVKAVRKVIGGGRYVSAALAEKLAASLPQGAGGMPHELLSDREFQVLRMIASGKAVSEIASELYLSVKTVSTYRTRILEKMGLKSNAELTRYALQNKLVE
jgi:DNA-binding NarL/FixJ family response regulator